MKTEIEWLEQEIKANYEANLAAIKQLKECIPAVEATQKRLETLMAANNPERSISEVIEELIKKSSDAFDIPAIALRYYQLTGRRSSNIRRLISQSINMFKHRKPPEIEVIKPGEGRRSGTYKYIKP